jgi:hypothetical protein
MAKKTNSITKQEAVRRALVDKGRDATPSQLKPYIKEKFGFDMSPEHITSCKTKVLKAGKAKKEPSPKPSATTASPPLNKFEAVKRTLAALGPDAMPLAIQGYVKKQFGIDVSTAVVSAYKKELKARARKKPGPKPKQQPVREPVVVPSAPTPAKAPAKNGITLEDIQSVQGLIGRVGPDQLKGLIDLLSK